MASSFICKLFAVLTTLLFTSVVNKKVAGDYIVSVHVTAYENPTHVAGDFSAFEGGNIGCCDRRKLIPCEGESLCDTRFVFCLQGLRDSHWCPWASVRLSYFYGEPQNRHYLGIPEDQLIISPNYTLNGVPTIDFSQDTFLGVPNPMELKMPGAFRGIQLIVTAVDNDFGHDRDDPIELYYMILSREDLNTTRSLVNQTGIYDVANISMTVRVYCDPNSYGNICQFRRFCEEDPSACNNRGDCRNGELSPICTCYPDSGFTGDSCDINIDDCPPHNCSGRGNCTDLVNAYECTCYPGFTGPDCEIDIDDCISVNCTGNGACIDHINSYQCSCYHGFTGPECETDIDDCIGVVCSEKSVCIDGIATYSCQCIPNFPGDIKCVKLNWLPGLIAAIVAILLALLIVILLLVLIPPAVRKRKQAPIKNISQIRGSVLFLPEGSSPQPNAVRLEAINQLACTNEFEKRYITQFEVLHTGSSEQIDTIHSDNSDFENKRSVETDFMTYANSSELDLNASNYETQNSAEFESEPSFEKENLSQTSSSYCAAFEKQYETEVEVQYPEDVPELDNHDYEKQYLAELETISQEYAELDNPADESTSEYEKQYLAELASLDQELDLNDLPEF